MKKILTSILLSSFCLLNYFNAGGQNRAFDNNGQDAYVVAPYVMPFVNTDFTIEAWVYYPAPGSIGNGSHSHTIMATEHSDQRGFVLRYGITSDWLGGSSGIQTEFLVGDGSNWQTAKMMPPTTQNGFGVNSLYNVGWNHIAVVKSGTSITMYLNGKNNNLYLPYTMPGIAGYPTTNRALRIGESYFTGRRAAGPIDEVKIWNVPRTATEIATDASGETCTNFNTNLVAYYKLNEASGNSYTDYSFNNNTATKAGPGTQTFPTVTLTNANTSIPGTLNFASFTQRNDISNLTLDFPASSYPICIGDSTQNLVSTTNPGLTFSWTPTTGITDPTVQSATFKPTTTTAYTLTATNPDGCIATLLDTVKVSIVSQPTATLTTSNVCFGDTIGVTLSNVLNNTTPQQGFASITPPFGTSPSQVGLLNADYTQWKVTPLATGYFYFRNIDAISGCASATDSFLITVNNIDSISPSPLINCTATGTQIYANEAGATAYSWSPSAGLSNSNLQNPLASPSAATTYTVSITTAAGCVIKRTVQVNVGITPIINGLSISDTTLCINTQTLATALYDEPLDFTYYDSSPSLRALSVGDPMYAASNQIPAQASPWPRTITVSGLPTTNALYKLKAVEFLEFNTPDLSDKDIWLVSPSGDTVMITSDAFATPDNGVGNVNLTFADDGAIGFQSVLGSGITSGTYKCRNSQPNEVGEPLNPSILLSSITGNLNGDWKFFMQDDHIAQNANFSGGTINGIKLYFGAPEYTYNFTPSAAFEPVLAGSPHQAYTNQLWAPVATVFTVTATSTSGCTATATANFAGERPSYTPTITASPNLCTGDTINPTANTSGGTTVVVYTSPYLSPYTVGNGKFLPTSTGTYSVIVQESGSLCTATDTILVNVGTNFTLNPITDTTINTGDTARLIASVPTNVLTNVNTLPSYDSSIVVPDSSILVLPLVIPSSEFTPPNYQTTIAGIWLYLSSLPSHNFEDSIVVYAASGTHYVNPPSSLQIGYNYLPFTNPLTLQYYQDGINVVLLNYSNSSWTLPYKKSLGFPFQLGIYDPQTSAKIDSAQNAISPVGVYKLVSSAVPSSYAWSPAMTLTDPNNDTTLAYPLATTMYTLTATNGGCIKTETVTVNVGTVLPIRLSTFNVVKTNKGDLIKWTTETETNNSYFTIEHSTDAIKYVAIGKVISKDGNSQKRLDYSFEHTKPSVGYNYYRLLQTDIDGKTKVASDVKSVFWNNTRNPMSVYPNPASSEITLEFISEKNVNTTIHIVDMTGRKIKTLQANSTIGTNMITIGVSEFGSGIYNLQILEDDKLITILKLEKL